MTPRVEAAAGPPRTPRALVRRVLTRPGRVLAASKVTAAGVAAVWAVVAARILSVEEFASLSLLLALGVIAVTLADAGLGVTLAAEVGRHPDRAGDAWRRGIRVRAGTGLLAAGVTFLGFTVAADASAAAPLVFGVSIVATAMHTSVAAVLRARDDVAVEAVTDVAARIGVLVVAVAAVAAGAGLTGVAAVYAVADLLVLVAFVRRAHRLPAGPPIDLAWRELLPLAVVTPLGTVYWRLDVWLLGLLGSARGVGLYSAAFRLLDGALLPSMALSSLVAPAVAAEPRRAGALARRRALQAVVTVLPLVVAAALAAAPVLGLLYGESYDDAAAMLRVLAAAAVPSAVALILAPVAAVRDRRRYAIAVVVALVLNAAGNLVLIPRHGAIAAAWTTLASQVVLCGLYVWAIGGGSAVRRRRVGGPPGSAPR